MRKTVTSRACQRNRNHQKKETHMTAMQRFKNIIFDNKQRQKKIISDEFEFGSFRIC